VLFITVRAPAFMTANSGGKEMAALTTRDSRLSPAAPQRGAAARGDARAASAASGAEATASFALGSHLRARGSPPSGQGGSVPSWGGAASGLLTGPVGLGLVQSGIRGHRGHRSEGSPAIGGLPAHPTRRKWPDHEACDRGRHGQGLHDCSSEFSAVLRGLGCSSIVCTRIRALWMITPEAMNPPRRRAFSPAFRPRVVAAPRAHAKNSPTLTESRPRRPS
jgi:hypothetical protein